MKQDMFDKVMSLPGLRLFYAPYKKHKEVLLYLVFGGITTVVSIGSFAALETGLGMNELVANVISWVLAVSLAYATNRTWVFGSRVKGKAFWAEALSFFSGRILTLLLEEVILLVFVTWLAFPGTAVKVVAQVVVLVSNYIISKRIIFKKK